MPQARTQEDRLSRRVLIVALLAAIASAAPAADLGELSARLARLDASPWNGSAERAFVADLDAAAVAARSSGSAARNAGELRRLLAAAHRHYAASIDKRRDEIIAADGDLEAAQTSDEWREREELALRTLYHLNWAYLESATRYETSSGERRTWLRKAASGFGEFIGAGDPALSAESLYGRGLCMRALGESSKAASDFRAALEAPPSQELAPSIRSALVETLIDTERLSEALKVSRDLVKTNPSGESEFLRAKVLLLALASLKLDASTKRGYRNEVSDLVGRLERRGGQWASLARQLVSAGITRPEEWLDQGGGATMQWVVAEALRGRGQCDEAIPLYEKLVPKQGVPSTEVALALGSCRFEVGDYAGAYATLERVERKQGGARADAAYLRFKAAEALDHGESNEQSTSRLETAVRDYVAVYPDHPSVFEARYRLGEIERDRGNLLQAAEAFDAVSGDSPLRLQALFQSAQCSVEAWEKRVKQDAAPNPELAAASLQRLRAFLRESDAFEERKGGSAADRAMLAPMQARARVLSAVVLTGGIERRDLEEALVVLDGFDERYPNETDLLTEARALRAIAYLGLERFAEAETAVAAFLASPRRGERDYRLLKQLGVRTMRLAEEQRAAGNVEAQQALRRQALGIYAELIEAADAGEVEPGSADGLRELVADLSGD